jgi:hypothetical protein
METTQTEVNVVSQLELLYKHIIDKLNGDLTEYFIYTIDYIITIDEKQVKQVIIEVKYLDRFSITIIDGIYIVYNAITTITNYNEFEEFFNTLSSLRFCKYDGQFYDKDEKIINLYPQFPNLFDKFHNMQVAHAKCYMCDTYTTSKFKTCTHIVCYKCIDDINECPSCNTSIVVNPDLNIFYRKHKCEDGRLL